MIGERMAANRAARPVAPARAAAGGSARPAARQAAGANAPAAIDKADKSRQVLSGTLDELYGLYNTLKEQGAASSSESGTLLGNIAAGVRGSVPGEVVESMMGTKAQTARDSIRMTRPLIIASLKDALHLSAQQLNSNKELQLWLDAATNPKGHTYESNLAALNNLARIASTGKIYAAPKAAAQGDKANAAQGKPSLDDIFKGKK